MGKRIITQRRGRGTLTYRVKKRAFRYYVGYPRTLEGEGTIIQLLNSPAHTSPLAMVKSNQEMFYIPAFKGMVEGQKIAFGGKEIKHGNILQIKNIPVKTQIYNIESKPGDGGKFIRTSGSYAEVSRIIGDKILVLLPSKKEREFHPECRATIGQIAGAGRLDKPIVKAGKMHYMKKARNKLWPRTSAVKMNVIDHPFGSGRGKRIKSKIAKRNAPAGRRVGLLSPRRTGRKK